MASFDEAKFNTTMYGSFATYNPTTGENKNADSLPVGSIYRLTDGTVISSGIVTVTNLTTGRYKWSTPIAATGGFTVGEYYEAWITAIVTGDSAVTQSAPVTAFKVTATDVDYASTGVVDVNVTAMATGVVNTISDGILTRSVTAAYGGGVEATATEHTLCTVILACLEFDVAGSGWNIRKSTGTTHVTKVLTTSAGADPIVGVT
jgi:hypothetical protein